ncbi:phosphate transport system protein [Bifidobacterium bohemicum]|uniref:Phosphate-specific transport system accessory protein PhoU n=1 Tax=Bifidobacterium bohemicum DSM 22767 TaxID=1437606 RepID=A0A086ZGQ0_9BIFI|nr:phosphate signaling complex protein PhoU [Bifidobacterium bohemicum]KFI45700.1 phosphate uptake regulator, PhoU [Bifidobacterium bohemicum DSM 22767]SCC07394.1 phosphate transport system protein [Bifidobacterium bohemicum]
MRVIYNQELKDVADDVEHLTQAVSQAMHGAGKALIDGDMDTARAVANGDKAIDEIAKRVIDQCVRFLAQQSPVATDLRVIVATQRLSTTLERMGDLAQHIALTVLRTSPSSPLPDDEATRAVFQRMREFLDITADRLPGMLADRDTGTAEEVIRDDNQLDEMHDRTFDVVLSDSWNGTKQQLIDVVLLARFMERLGDHAVSVARQVVYIVSGFDPSKEPQGLDD